jgi:hypothetical protein
MRSSQVVRAYGCQCQSRNSLGLDPRILRHSGIWGAADEAVLNKHIKRNTKKFPWKKACSMPMGGGGAASCPGGATCSGGGGGGTKKTSGSSKPQGRACWGGSMLRGLTCSGSSKLQKSSRQLLLFLIWGRQRNSFSKPETNLSSISWKCAIF